MRQESSDLSAVSSLGDPVRARLYQVVSRSAAPVGRDEAAAEAGIGRPLAAYHLDKLVEIGLLTASYQRPAGRSGPERGARRRCTAAPSASSRRACRRASTNWPPACLPSRWRQTAAARAEPRCMTRPDSSVPTSAGGASQATLGGPTRGTSYGRAERAWLRAVAGRGRRPAAAELSVPPARGPASRPGLRYEPGADRRS